MIDFIPTNCRRILEIGCGEGVFGSLVRQHIPDTEYWGIEYDPRSARIAGKRIDHVINGDFFSVVAAMEKNYFDCIILNDVLEHFTDPWNALLIIRSLLSEKGYVVCSIPNVRYVGNLQELIFKKDWEYKSSGILDKTHYRFYTEKSILRMFRESGFDVLAINGINPTRSRKVRFFVWLTFGFFRDIPFQQFGLTATATAN